MATSRGTERLGRSHERQGHQEETERDARARQSGVRAFVLAAGEITGPDQAALFVRILPKIKRYVEDMQPPFLIRVGKDGGCEVLHPKS